MVVSRSIQQDFRDIVGVTSAPIDTIKTDILPVAVITGNLGLPKPKSNQRLRWTLVALGNSSTEYQLATATNTTKIYLVGFNMANFNATSGSFGLWDTTSAGILSISGNTAYQDQSAYLGFVNFGTATNERYNLILPMPIEIKQGLRAFGGGAGISCWVTVYYIEETVTF
jgi:hypothetical protein